MPHREPRGPRRRAPSPAAAAPDEPGDDDGEYGADGPGFSDADEAPEPASHAVEYEAMRSDALPWRSEALDAPAEGDEVGFMGLESIAAGSYDIVVGPGGGTLVRMKPSAPAAQAAAPPRAPASAPAPKRAALATKPAHDRGAPAAAAARTTAAADDIPDAAADAAWEPLGLHPLLRAAVRRLGFARPTRIQAEAVPAALAHFKDVVGAAETGSGKTLAYGLPLVHRLLDRRERLGLGTGAGGAVAAVGRRGAFARLPALVLTPTRELAVQVAAHLAALCAGTFVSVVPIVGGLAVEKQARLLRRRPDVVVATPGRLWDVLRSGVGGDFLSELHRLQFLVLDEADRLCERGHYDALNGILAAMRPTPPSADAAAAPGSAAAVAGTGAVLDPEAERILDELRGAAAAAGGGRGAAAAAAVSRPARLLRGDAAADGESVHSDDGDGDDVDDGAGADDGSADAESDADMEAFIREGEALLLPPAPAAARRAGAIAASSAGSGGMKRRRGGSGGGGSDPRGATNTAGDSDGSSAGDSDDGDGGDGESNFDDVDFGAAVTDDAGAGAAAAGRPPSSKKQRVNATASGGSGSGGRAAALAALLAAGPRYEDFFGPRDGEGDDAEDGGGKRAPAAGAVAASAAAAAPLVVDAPVHYKRQTFLFSATLGLATAHTTRDAAAALVEARAAQGGGGGGGGGSDAAAARLSKKAYRRALVAAKAMTPVEVLCARVGLLGKPVLIRVGGAAGDAPPPRGDVAVSAATADGDEVAAAAATAPPASTIGTALRSTVALPAGLRLARFTIAGGTADKDAALYRFLLRYPGPTIVFVNAISTLKRVAATLAALRLPALPLHAHLQQRQRLKTLDRFRAGCAAAATAGGGATGGGSRAGPPPPVLVATDVAARGLDIPSVQYVLHYTLPPTAEQFVHRCGRTARAAAHGLAAAFVGPEDTRAYARIAAALGLPAGLPEFPVDDRYDRALGDRLSLARRIVAAEAAASVTSSDAHRLQQLAEKAGLDAADGDADVGRRRGRTPVATAGGRGGDEDDDDEGGGGDGGEGGAEARRVAKAAAAATRGLRRDLDALLRTSLLPTGVSHRYVTSNPLLGQAAHPLRAGVLVPQGPAVAAAAGARAGGVKRLRAGAPDAHDDGDDDGDAGSGGGGDDGGDNGDAAQAAPAAAAPAAAPVRSASGALVAPRLSLPATVAAPLARGARYGGILGGSTPDEGDALAALARGGTQSWLPAASGKGRRGRGGRGGGAAPGGRGGSGPGRGGRDGGR